MGSSADEADIAPVVAYFKHLQDQICAALETADGEARFRREDVPGPGGGLARPRVLAAGRHIEKAAVQFTHSVGAQLPPAATERRPDLAGLGFEAAAISLIVHPANPHAPTTHMNLRYFHVAAQEPHWYFGGGFDLTPYYGYAEDCHHWHQRAAQSVGEHYAAMKAACDDYFYLPHRQEHRGIGGLFFDDWRDGGFAASFDLVARVGDNFLPAYLPILERRIHTPTTESERHFQLYRRGRYVEFNLLQDRGTRYGLQSGRRVESVLASLPPLVAWEYAPEWDGREAALISDFLTPRDWLGDAQAVDNSGD